MKPSPIKPTVDFDRDGVQHGFLRLPYSRDDSAWGAIMIPITVVRNGEGPTALLTGANHGDEFEGPIALFDLANGLRADEITGRVIIVPGMNHPAFCAGRRTSPIDNGNLNRSFPGRPDGTVTERIADYFQRFLLPGANIVLDIHSGGRTLEFIPYAAIHALDDAGQQARCQAAMDAFNAPYSLKLIELDVIGMYDTAAEEMGKVFLSTELGGGGTASAHTVEIAKRGIRNVLKHVGILSGEPERSETVNLDMPDDSCYVISHSSGLLEMCVDLGAMVSKGDVIGRVFDVTRTGVEPVEYRAGIDGLLAGRHFPGHVKMGDFLALVAVPQD
ncbi:MAG: N-alpha-acetyl diaminobutyric acid deacetylase DoeB [Alphaproteobacteria bacterium]|nr:N-alpha-acetyl diaminobutyric acid deacetylase DoeB [Alphaproteobacteria bacterium]